MPAQTIESNGGPIEIDHKRAVSDLGLSTIGAMQLKIYGLVAENMSVTDQMLTQSKEFLRDEVLGRVRAMGDSNDLGFVIIHPGELGLTISAHWWAQGSVLCQHIYRRHYSDDAPLDTVTRPVVACVWELAIINAEQEAWRGTMMNSTPNRSAYLAQRMTASAV